jgi:hypothetical protein
MWAMFVEVSIKGRRFEDFCMCHLARFEGPRFFNTLVKKPGVTVIIKIPRRMY